MVPLLGSRLHMNGDLFVRTHFDRRLCGGNFKSRLRSRVSSARLSIPRDRPLTGCGGDFVNDALHLQLHLAPQRSGSLKSGGRRRQPGLVKAYVARLAWLSDDGLVESRKIVRLPRGDQLMIPYHRLIAPDCASVESYSAALVPVTRHFERGFPLAPKKE